MKKSLREKKFKSIVENKFSIYSSLFLSLPFRKIQNIGMLIPLLVHDCRKGLDAGKEPAEILDSFFTLHTDLSSEDEKIDFMFRVIQYVERQVVLYDSVEDAGFGQMVKLRRHTTLEDCRDFSQNFEKIHDFNDKISKFSVRIVLTAHPTQFYPRSVLDIMEQLRTQISENRIDEIENSLQQLGMTSLMNSKRPTPLDEAKNIIYFLRSIYYNAVGDLYSHIKKSISTDDFDNPEIIQLGFWPGGDRDGNPYVTSTVTAQVADELRMTLMKCYYHEVKRLEQKLTFMGVKERIEQLRAELYSTMFDPSKTISVNTLLEELEHIKQMVIDRFNSLYMQDLDNLIEKIKIFKTHFATLDIRQNHQVHEKVITRILVNENRIKTSLTELAKQDLISILINEDFDVHPDQFDDEIDKDTILTISQIKTIQDKNGEPGCNRYIISNSEDIFSVLFVFALLRWCTWKSKQIPVDIIPLFESMQGMRQAETIMQELLLFEAYRSHIRFRGDYQTVMLGFSDGTKDGGYMKANWSIFKTKEALSAVCQKNGIRVIFFDGRGGPPARGGGKTHRFYASQSPEIASHAIQLTVQGQTITSHYGTRDHFIHNCEQLLTAGLSQRISQKQASIPYNYRDIMEKLAELSHKKYTDLKNHELFLSYLENISTLRFYSMANIGSRPAKRGTDRKLTLSDLRAISFVGSWSQLRQNVPGYFGLGTALKAVSETTGLDTLQKMYSDVPFFKTLILNSMMSMSKCYFNLTAYVGKDEVYKDFWNILFEEFELSKKMVLSVSNNRFLMEEEPISRLSIKIREDMVLPLLTVQQYAFQKLKNTTRTREYEKIILRSLYGNINASRNSA